MFAFIQQIADSPLGLWPGGATVVCLALGLCGWVVFSFRRTPERKTASASLIDLKRRCPDEYTVFDELYIQRHRGEGSTRLDHVVVSRFGLFVIQIEEASGRVSNPAHEKKWTSQSGRKGHTWVNPLSRNRFHVDALANFLAIPASYCHSIILFTNPVEFDETPPENVITSQLDAAITGYRDEIVPARMRREVIKALEQIATPAYRGLASRTYQAVKQRSYAPLAASQTSSRSI